MAGIHANPKLAPKHVDAGYRMITVSSDAGNVAAGGARDLRSIREAEG